MTSGILEFSRLSSEIRVGAEQHRQLGAVESTEPRGRRKVGPVTGVFVAVCSTAGLLAKASRLGSWTEEGRQKTDFSERRVWSGVAVGSEWDAVFGVGADDGGLNMTLLAVWNYSRPVSTYNFGLLAC